MLSQRSRLSRFSLVCLPAIFGICFAARPGIAQVGVELPGSLAPNDYENDAASTRFGMGEWPVSGRVMTIAGIPISGARVQVQPSFQAGDIRFFRTNASGMFETDYTLNMRGTEFEVRLTVRKKGFQTADELVDFSEFPKPVSLPITLLPQDPDPALLPRQDLISHLLPELEKLAPSDGISAKSEKEYAKGVGEFALEGRPGDSLTYFFDVIKRDPECAKCRTMLALAELDSGDWDGAARHANEAAQWTVKHTTGRSPQALVLGGLMESWMHDPQQATNFLAWADKVHPKDPLVLQEIGRAQLELRDFATADAYLSKALAAGAGPEARLLRIKALLGEDEVGAASAEMTRYLNGQDVKKMPLEVRRAWAEIQDHKQIEALYGASKRKELKREAVQRVNYLRFSAAQLKGLTPAKNQEELQPILAAVGKNVADLFHDFQDSISVEEIRQEKIGRKGQVGGSIEGKFRYLCLMPPDPDTPGFTEYRRSLSPGEGLAAGVGKGYMLTSGFASAALIFDPPFQSGSEFRYLGRQTLDGREAYVIAFAQIPAKAMVMGSFKSGSGSVPTFQQGLAWIDAHNYQIIRLRTDLLKPLPEIGLTQETTQIDYQNVHFKKTGREFWLPGDVTVTVDWDGKTLRNIHSYSDFRAFDVASREKIGAPKKPKSST